MLPLIASLPLWAVPIPPVDGFDFPVGPPDATGWYDAQPFGRNEHLGEDWNARDGGDLGAPVHAIAGGLVVQVGPAGPGWGNVVMVVHRVDEPGGSTLVESLYAHLRELHVAEGQGVSRGAQLGTVGTAGGVYSPHLHFELRTRVREPVGRGYGASAAAHVSPTAFIEERRPQRPQ